MSEALNLESSRNLYQASIWREAPREITQEGLARAVAFGLGSQTFRLTPRLSNGVALQGVARVPRVAGLYYRLRGQSVDPAMSLRTTEIPPPAEGGAIDGGLARAGSGLLAEGGAGAFAGGAVQLGSDLLSNQHYSVSQETGRVGVAAAFGVGEAFVGGAVAGLACGPASPGCSLVFGTVGATLAAVGLSGVENDVFNALGLG